MFGYFASVSADEILGLDKPALRTFNMLRFLISLSIGVYAGIYIAQNYEVPRVDEPSKLYQRVIQFLEENKKKP
ncbi:short transmembrane mitochondrial protein 1-like [Temnothorax americanus]|uniref:short transmembrane mitochondrial protein 1-like n=1 Tax=Temnothorax americanus TaxID=1964332 RepID=UPI00406982C7